MTKGNIVLVPFPFTDLSGQKVRPALILYSSKNGEDCIVVFISSRAQKKMLEFDLALPASPANGLKIDSVIKIDKIATLQKKIVLGTLGILDLPSLTIIDTKLKKLFRL